MQYIIFMFSSLLTFILHNSLNIMTVITLIYTTNMSHLLEDLYILLPLLGKSEEWE